MPISMACPGCRRTVRFHDQARGTFACPACKTALTIGPPPAVVPPADPRAAEVLAAQALAAITPATGATATGAAGWGSAAPTAPSPPNPQTLSPPAEAAPTGDAPAPASSAPAAVSGGMPAWLQGVVLVLGGIGALVGSIFGSAIGRQVGQFVRQVVDPVAAPPARPVRAPTGRSFTSNVPPSPPPQVAQVNPLDLLVWDDPTDGTPAVSVKTLAQPHRTHPPQWPKVTWKLTPDPGPQALPADPAWKLRTTILDAGVRVLFSRGVRPLMLRHDGNPGGGGGESIRVLSLPNGEQLAEYDLASGWEPAAFGPEGTFLVAAPGNSEPPNPAEPTKAIAQLRDGLSGKLLGNLVVPDLGPPHLGDRAAFRFVSANRLILSRQKGTAVWDLPNLGPPRFVPCTDADRCSSPGGKWLLSIGRGVLKAFDLTTGAEVGRCVVGIPDEIFAWPTVSADGRWIALFSEVHYGTRVQILDFASGNRVREFFVKGRFHLQAAKDFAEWLPGSGGLLYGFEMLDIRSGAMYQSVPRNGLYFDDMNRRPIVLPNFTIVCRTEGSTGQGFTVESLRLDRLARSIRGVSQVVREESWPTLPAAVPAALEGLKPYGSEPLAGRTCGVDPSPQPHGRDFASLTTDCESEYYRSVRYAPLGEGLAVVHFMGAANAPMLPPPPNVTSPPLPSWLECYRPATGERVGETLDLPRGAKLSAVSPAGERFATVSGKNSERIDIWTRSPFARITGCAPGGESKAPPSRNSMADRELAVDWSGFGDEDRLWTLTRGNELTLWQLPEFKAIRRGTGAEFSARPTFSSTHRYLALSQARRVLFLDARTGDEVGEWPLPSLQPKSRLGTFSPDGKRFAVLDREWLHVLDLERGVPEPVHRLGRAATGLDWTDNDRVLLSPDKANPFNMPTSYVLYDLGLRRALWTYHLPIRAGDEREPFPDGRVRFFPDSKLLAGPHDGTATIVAAALPDPEAAKTIEARAKFPIRPLLTRGDRVRFELTGFDLPGLDEIRAGFVRQLEAGGLIVADDAPLTFAVTAQSLGSQPITLTVRGDTPIASRMKSVNYEATRIVSELRDAKRSTLWRDSFELTGRSEHEGRSLSREEAAQSAQLHLTDRVKALQALTLPVDLREQPGDPTDPAKWGTEPLGYGESWVQRGGTTPDGK